MGVSAEIPVRLGNMLRRILFMERGEQPSSLACALTVRESLSGLAGVRHEGAAYLLLNHLLSIDDRPSFDALAKGWVADRFDRPLSAREASEVVCCALFILRSGWPRAEVRPLLELIRRSRQGSYWVDLRDLARDGARHSLELARLIRQVALERPGEAAGAAAQYVLSRAHALHRVQFAGAPGWVVLSSMDAGHGFVAYFSRNAPDTPATGAIRAMMERTGGKRAYHVSPGRTVALAAFNESEGSLLRIRRDDADEEREMSSLQWSHSTASVGDEVGWTAEDVMQVFPSGVMLRESAAEWALGLRAP